MDKNIYSLVTKFRKAVECAKNEGAFNGNQILSRFPKGCCGIISSLLAKYLFENGINSYGVSGTFRSGNPEETQSHAWLVLEDNTIVDITGDQFKHSPIFLHYSEKVYVGPVNEFLSCLKMLKNFIMKILQKGLIKSIFRIKRTMKLF